MSKRFEKIKQSVKDHKYSRSLFARYFTVFILVIFVCFSILGAALLVFVGNYWQDEKTDIIKNNVRDVANTTSTVLSSGRMSADAEGAVVMLCNNLRTISKAVDSDFFIVGTSGKVILCQDMLSNDFQVDSNGSCSIHGDYEFSDDVLKKVAKGSFFEVSNLDGMFEQKHIVAAEPILVSGKTVAYSFCVQPATYGIESYVLDILKMFLFSSLFAFLLCFVAVYILTYNLTKPLRQMSKATKRYSIGDFSPRIDVKGRDELASLCSEFNSMATSLSILESSRRSFVANISHELKTPMTTIGGFIDGILDGTIPPDQREHYLQIVSDEVKRLSRLVVAMLNMSKIEAGEIQVHRSDFDITELIFSTMLSFEQAIESKNVDVKGLDMLSSTTVSADRDMLHQVIYNLVDNAVKFTPNGGEITVQLNSSDKKVTFSIRNSGMGISSEETSKIFERFYKVDKSRSYDVKGAGLGLYIVKTIIEMHGGQIQVQSEDGKYTEFIFSIPTGGY